LLYLPPGVQSQALLRNCGKTRRLANFRCISVAWRGPAPEYIEEKHGIGVRGAANALNESRCRLYNCARPLGRPGSGGPVKRRGSLPAKRRRSAMTMDQKKPNRSGRPKRESVLEANIERAMLASRWILIVFYFGLAFALGVYAVAFVYKTAKVTMANLKLTLSYGQSFSDIRQRKNHV
jgi:hypothetical protein